MNQLKTLIHIHTDYSFDSNISLNQLAQAVKREGIDCIAITDHDEIDGARRFAEMVDIKVIIGEEITTSDGDLIGLFLDRLVPPGMSARETAEAIKAQGGLVLLPHPFIKAFGCGLRDVSYEIADLVDAVEVCNAQNLIDAPNREARRFAEAYDLPQYVGADSHLASSIAPCHQTMGDFTDQTSFVESLRQAELTPGRHPLSYFAVAAYKTARYVAGMALPTGYGVNAQPYDARAAAARVVAA